MSEASEKRARQAADAARRARLRAVPRKWPSVRMDAHEWLTTEVNTQGEVVPTGPFARLLADILRADNAILEGHNMLGPPLTQAQTSRGIRRLAGEDYSHEPFHLAFERLIPHQSVSQVASLTGLDPDRVRALLDDEVSPTIEDMRQVAKAFKKDPSYFHEYRAAFIVEALMVQLAVNSEQTIVIYRKLMREVA